MGLLPSMNDSAARATLATRDFDQVRSRLLALQEVALLDVREEAPHAQAHPLFAANLPLSRIEVDAYAKLPRRSVPIVTIDDGEGLAQAAAQRLLDIGYTDVSVFQGGVASWKAAGGELFIDVNVPSKAFGELVESVCHTPSLPAQEVKALIDSGEDCVIVDARRFDEYQTMCIPGAVNVPGAELVFRIPHMAPDPKTKVIVNCAGRTRSLIGTQSLINAGLPNPVAALRNGTIGWTLARQQLQTGQVKRYPEVPAPAAAESQRAARHVADRAGVKRASRADVAAWALQSDRTTYFFDVRSPEEYERGHVPGFLSAPGGQLVQELEMHAPVRGARIVLVDDNGVRADMTASWLAQMAWEVFVLDGLDPDEFSEAGLAPRLLPTVPANDMVDARELARWLSASADTVVIDVSKHAQYAKGHIPGAWFLIRSLIDESVPKLPDAHRYVVTCADAVLAAFVAPELAKRLRGHVYVLRGGNAAWIGAGHRLEKEPASLASPPIDRYRRPYEGTDVTDERMKAYLDWEFGLVEQLRRDGTHHFRPICPETTG